MGRPLQTGSLTGDISGMVTDEVVFVIVGVVVLGIAIYLFYAYLTVRD